MHYYTDVLKKYAMFDGRAARKEFWMFTLWNAIISLALLIAAFLIAIMTGASSIFYIIQLYSLAVLLPVLGVNIRRLHDTGRSGWWILIGFIPIIGAIVLLIFFVQDSAPDNQYGPNPKSSVVTAVADEPPSSPSVPTST